MSALPSESSGISDAQALRVLARALGYVRPFRRELAIKLALMALGMLPQLVLPWPAKVVIDHVIGDVAIGKEVRPYPWFIAPLVHALAHASKPMILIAAVAVELLLLLFIGTYGTRRNERGFSEASLGLGQDTATRTDNQANFGFSYVSGLLGLFEYRYTLRLSQKLNHHYRSRAYERMQTLPMTTFDDERIGDAMYRVLYDTPSITLMALRVVLAPVAGPLNIALTIAVLVSVYGAASPVVLLALLSLPATLLVTWPFARLVRRGGAQSRQAGAITASTLEESMSHILAVQGLGGERRERARFDRDSRASFGAYRRWVLFIMLVVTIGALAGALLFGRVLSWVGDEIIDARLSVGDLGVLLTYFGAIAYAAGELGALWISVQDEAAGLQRVFWLMDLPEERECQGSVPLPRVEHSLRLAHVSFEYEPGRAVLSDVSFEAKRGQLTALIGPAGSGKTTLAYVSARFLEPSSGRVTIDGHDIALVTRSSLREQVAFVFQETTLLDLTIAENLRLGKRHASEAELVRATTTAGIYAFIDSLPEGFATRLGGAGSKLSVGQKQRLSIARALVCDAPIMIFDEPTSALDPDTEQHIVSALVAASRERIVIVIAHRLSTVRDAQQILLLERGRIVLRGSHAELMADTSAAYRELVQLQDARVR